MSFPIIAKAIVRIQWPKKNTETCEKTMEVTFYDLRARRNRVWLIRWVALFKTLRPVRRNLLPNLKLYLKNTNSYHNI